MVKLTGDNAEARRQSMRGAFYVYVRNGTIIMAKWPDQRKGPLSQKQQDAVEKFRQAAIATKYMDADDQKSARELTKGTNALPRDLLMQALYGRLGVVLLNDGTRIYSVAALKDASGLLDIITNAPGSMLYRGEDYWLALPPGASEQTLKMGEDGFPLWGASGGGGTNWYFNPPSAGNFTLASGDGTNLTLADDTDAGCTVDAGAPVAATKTRIAYRSIPNPNGDWSLTAHVETQIPNINYSSIGVFARYSGNGRFHAVLKAGEGAYYYARVPSLTGSPIGIATNASWWNNPWFQLRRNGAALEAWVSADGKLWTLWSTYPIASYLGADPDQYGLLASYARTTGPNLVFSCQMLDLVQ